MSFTVGGAPEGVSLGDCQADYRYDGSIACLILGATQTAKGAAFRMSLFIATFGATWVNINTRISLVILSLSKTRTKASEPNFNGLDLLPPNRPSNTCNDSNHRSEDVTKRKVFLPKRTLTAKAIPKMDNDRVERVAAELDTRDDARGDVEKGSPRTSGTNSDSVPAGRRINEFTLRGKVASADGAPKGW
ncbi:hypothetical protein B9Z19DRAFT_1122836 [Tuber borchii]|uniref:Uncharacterized protein n=1 Tax=Tuber borchii TaxID=42251 RepID=A0A2T6ZZL1_TUBBO|nr:hypothetical protein B9Z19DRAFT_1122836 [Tuber borchii]